MLYFIMHFRELAGGRMSLCFPHDSLEAMAGHPGSYSDLVALIKARYPLSSQRVGSLYCSPYSLGIYFGLIILICGALPTEGNVIKSKDTIKCMAPSWSYKHRGSWISFIILLICNNLWHMLWLWSWSSHVHQCTAATENQHAWRGGHVKLFGLMIP